MKKGLRAYLISSCILMVLFTIFWVVNSFRNSYDLKWNLILIIPVVGFFTTGILWLPFSVFKFFYRNLLLNGESSFQLPEQVINSFENSVTIEKLYLHFVLDENNLVVEIGGVSIYELLGLLDVNERLNIIEFSGQDDKTSKISFATNKPLALKEVIDKFPKIEAGAIKFEIDLIDRNLKLNSYLNEGLTISQRKESGANYKNMLEWILKEMSISIKNYEYIIEYLSENHEGYILIQNNNIFEFENFTDLNNYLEE